MLDLLDELGITEDTFVMYSSDNGPHMNTWPDGAMTPFRSEKNTNWEGAFRVPMLVRWPGHDRRQDRFPTRSCSTTTGCPPSSPWPATPDAPERLKKGTTVNGKKFKNHIDGFNFLPYLAGEAKEGPRKLFFYFSDDGDVLAIRYDNWKLVFIEQRCQGTLQVWAEPFTRLRLPKIFNLRTDP